MDDSEKKASAVDWKRESANEPGFSEIGKPAATSIGSVAPKDVCWLNIAPRHLLVLGKMPGGKWCPLLTIVSCDVSYENFPTITLGAVELTPTRNRHT